MKSEVGDYLKTIAQREEGAKIVRRGTRFTTFEDAVPGREGVITKTSHYEDTGVLTAKATPFGGTSNLFTVTFELATDVQTPITKDNPIPPPAVGERLVLFAETIKEEHKASTGEITESGLRIIRFDLWNNIEHPVEHFDQKAEVVRTIKKRKIHPQPLIVDRSNLTQTWFNFI